MTADQLMRMTVKDLRALAERRGVAGTGRMRKDQLIGALTPLLAAETRRTPAPTAAPPQGSSGVAAPPSARREGPDPGLSIPESYDTDRLVLLVQDPHHIFAYWEINADTYARIAAAAGSGAAAVLVLHTGTGAEQREIDLRGGNYYLSVAPGGTYRAEVALRGRDGRLHVLAVSNFVQTPASGPSPRTDATWMQVDESFHELLSLAGLPGCDTGSFDRLKARTLETRILAEDTAAGPGLAGDSLSSAELTRRARAHLADSLSSSSLSSSSLGKR